ncbi:MAG: ABC transporter ATP-binding protein [Chloroflexi bacterium]|nr:ABC transporter ATP-binding protein [Chloroflexota bacterium]
MREIILEVDGLSKSFGGLQAVRNVSFALETAKIKALIGPNGAGKTTIFNLMTGFLSPTSGSIKYRGKDLVRMKPEDIVRVGISRTFQIVRLFKSLSVLENVMVGCHPTAPAGILSSALALPRVRQRDALIRDRAMHYLEYTGLAGKHHDFPSNLSCGQQRLLELARALASEPKVLLLDEPAAGLNDVEREVLGGLFLDICRRGTTILLVEHNMDLVIGVSHEILVLNYGEKLAEGTPEQIQSRQEVIAAYLGETV